MTRDVMTVAREFVTYEGVEYDLNLLVRAAFEARSQRPTPFTDEEWERQSKVSRGSINRLRREILDSMEQGEF